MTASKPSPEGRRDRKLKALVVEDSADDAELVAQSLTRAGYEVEWQRVETSEELDRSLAAGGWDVVVSDFSMPRLGGWEALGAVRRKAADLPFVIVSGHIGEERAAQMMRLGASDYVSKDNLERLAPAIDREVREAGIRRSARETERVVRLQAAALAAVPNAVYMIDEDGRILWVNGAFAEGTGHRLEEAVGRSAAELLVPSDRAAQRRYRNFCAGAHTGRALRSELVRQHSDGALRTVSATITPLRDDGRNVAIVVEDDITADKLAEAQIAFLAHHDPLTRLPNRTLLHERLERAIARSRRSGSLLAVVFLDLDRFKGVNDLHGHVIGDGVLVAVAQRIAAAVREADTVARVGGDEFVLLLQDLQAPGDAERVTRKVIDAVRAPLIVEGRDLRIGASAGIALHPLDGADPTELVRAADEAIYRTKHSGTEIQLFSAIMSEEASRRVALDQELRSALEADNLWLEYQPVIDVRTQAINGAEALVRMQGSSPAEFVPLAEETGLVRRLDEWVLREACRQASVWRRGGVAVPRVAVNVSGLHLRDEQLVSTIEAILADAGASGDWLALEFTERTTFADVDLARGLLSGLRALGVEIWVDDFGTGYSSLAYLSTLPIDRLKIDRSFVSGLTVDRRHESIVLAVVGMAHSLGLRVVAEGVETSAQRDFLVECGCDELQGYLVSRPVRARRLEQVLERQAALTALA